VARSQQPHSEGRASEEPPAERHHPAGRQTVIVVGAGLVGMGAAWWLQSHGHQVMLVDPGVASADHLDARSGSGDTGSLNGSQAALGVLMARVFHRSKGRAWRLRQHSLELWGQWRSMLASRGQPIPWRPGLLLLASDPAELDRQKALVADPMRQELGLELWSQERLEELSPSAPEAVGGLFSEADGQLDPAMALRALRRDGDRGGLCHQSGRAVALEPRDKGWRVRLASGGVEEAEWVLVCAGLASGSLLETLGVKRAMEPVLGQAMEMELATDELQPTQPDSLWNWPGAVVRSGINLVPRPDLAGGRRFWLGATLEPGLKAEAAPLEAMRALGGAAPAWLVAAQEQHRWQGLRCRPVGQPAPLLEEVAPRLLLLSGHYRNGVLLAPASADWALQRIRTAGRES
jgi:glycine/D-amino acid oxidase-like deaminating enzyme